MYTLKPHEEARSMKEKLTPKDDVLSKEREVVLLKKWLPLVSGSEEHIRAALKRFSAEGPRSTDELQKAISEEIRKGLKETLEEADKQRRHLPY